MSPYVQAGFAGFCFVVFGTLIPLIVWLIKKLLDVIRESNKVIAGNTEAITSVRETANDTKWLMSDIRDQLLKRPCLMANEEDRKLVHADAATRHKDSVQAHEDHVEVQDRQGEGGG